MGAVKIDPRLKPALRAGGQRNYPLAARLLEELVAQDSAPPQAWLLLGRSYHAMGDYGRALATFRDYLSQHPQAKSPYFFIGRTYLALNMAYHALPFLKRALELNPQSTQTLALLGIAYLKSKRSQEAVEYLERAVEAAPDNPRIYRAYLNALFIRGIRLCRSGDANLGAQMLRFTLNNGVDVPLLRLELGRVYRESGQLEEALTQYTAAVALAPQDVTIHWYRCSMLMALGRIKEAEQEIDTVRELGGDPPEIPWNQELVDRFMIRSLLERRSWRRAAQTCGDWLRHRRPDPTIHAMYSEALRNLGDLETAQNHLDRALSLAPKQTELWYAQIILAWEREDWDTLERTLDKADRLGAEPVIIERFRALWADHSVQDDKIVIEQLIRAIRSSGPIAELMFALAQRYLHLGLCDLAETWYAKTRTVEGGNERAYLGEIAALEAQLSEGDGKAEPRLRRLYELYLSRWPDNRTIRREWALFLFNRQDYPRAIEELTVLLAWEPSNPTLRRVLSYALRKMERYREATVLLKNLLKENPRDIKLLLEFAGCLERSGAMDYAAMVLEKAQDLFKTTAQVALALGTLRYRQKRLEDALDAFRRASELAPQDPRPYQWMAALYKQTGVAELAQRYAEEARKREPRAKGTEKKPGAPKK